MKTKYKVPKRLKAKLQAEVNHLTKHPEEIKNHWTGSSALFRFVTPSGAFQIRPDGKQCGCMVMIREGGQYNCAYVKRLTREIRADKRLPTQAKNIKPKHLPYFMEWMLKLAVIFEWER